jgi:hypothetical protein
MLKKILKIIILFLIISLLIYLSKILINLTLEEIKTNTLLLNVNQKLVEMSQIRDYKFKYNNFYLDIIWNTLKSTNMHFTYIEKTLNLNNYGVKLGTNIFNYKKNMGISSE